MNCNFLKKAFKILDPQYILVIFFATLEHFHPASRKQISKFEVIIAAKTLGQRFLK